MKKPRLSILVAVTLLFAVFTLGFFLGRNGSHGSVELSVDGRRVAELGHGEVFGAQAWLDHLEHKHSMSVVSLTPLTYLEINPSALALASEEVLERFRRQLATVIVRRLADLAKQMSEKGQPAVRGEFTSTGGLDLQLIDN